MTKVAVYTSKEKLVDALFDLGELSKGDPYKEALHTVLVQLSGMSCKAATYTSIVTGYAEDDDWQWRQK